MALDIRILDPPAKPSWVQDLCGFLHDANLLEEPRWDEHAGRFEMQIARLCYERGRRARMLRIIPCAVYCHVPAILSVAPVLSVRYKSRGSGGGLLLGLSITRAGRLKICTDFGNYTLELGPSACLEVKDTGPPDGIYNFSDILCSPRLPEHYARILETKEV